MTAGRMRRRLVALLALVTGAVNLVTTATTQPAFRFGVFRIAADVVFGARYTLLVAGLTLVLVTRGLLHGKRNAARLAVVAAAVSVPGHHLKQADVIGLVCATALLATLAWSWRSFAARSDPGLARQGVRILLVGLAAVFAYGAIGFWFLDEEFLEGTSATRSVANAARLLFLLPTGLEPVSRHGRWFVESVRIAALLVVMTALVRLVATVVVRRGHRVSEEAVVRDLLDRHATTALAHFQLLDDKLWFVEGEAFVGYVVQGTVALALGGPIGAPDARVQVARSFVEFCQANGWTPAFHQLTDADAAELRGLGVRTIKIGEEAVVDVQHFDVEGKEFKSLRSALRRVERGGGHIELHRPPHAPELLHELRAVSDAWLASGGHRERTFTLGRFDAGYLNGTTIMTVVQDGGIVAFANILPSYRSDDGNFDLMRRRPDAPNGVMDYLFVALIDHFRSEGRTGMNLGLAPLSGLDGDSPADRALRLVYERGRTVFNFEGLRRFKEKWQPRWEDRWLGYLADTDLPRVAAAVTRAGELPDPRSPAARLRAVGRRFPFASAVTVLSAWLMAATAVDRPLHRQLLRHFGLGWHDLGRLQLWRLPTAQFVQTRAGFVVSNLLLLSIVFLAEQRLRSRLTIAVFFLGDWISTLTVLVGARIAAAAGSTAAAKVLTERDGGLSSGIWACATVLALSLPGTRRRVAATSAVLVFLAASLAVQHELFDIQHLVAAVAGGAVYLIGRRKRSLTTDA